MIIDILSKDVSADLFVALFVHTVATTWIFTHLY